MILFSSFISHRHIFFQMEAAAASHESEGVSSGAHSLGDNLQLNPQEAGSVETQGFQAKKRKSSIDSADGSDSDEVPGGEFDEKTTMR
jgi:hypothetical protein